MRKSFKPVVLVIAAAIVSAAPGQALAQWIPNGVPIGVPTYDEDFPRVASDGSGGALVVWQENERILAQRLTERGRVAPGWAVAGLPVCTNPWQEREPFIVTDNGGGAFVVWYDKRADQCTAGCLGEDAQLYVQHITGTGTIAKNWPSEGLSVGSGHGPQAGFEAIGVPDGREGVILAWLEKGAGSDVHAQRISRSGAVLWGENGLVACRASGDQVHPTIIADGSGGALIAWQDGRDSLSGAQVFGQHLSAKGVSLWGSSGIRLSKAGLPNQAFPALASDDKGGAIVAWQVGSAGEADIYAQHISWTGERLWRVDAAVTQAHGDQILPQVVPNADGGTIIAWFDFRSMTNKEVYAQRLTERGAVSNGWPQDGTPVSVGPSLRTNLHVVADERTGAYLAWMGGTLEYDLVPHATHLTRHGTIAEGWPEGGTTISDAPLTSPNMLDLAADAEGGAVLAWGANTALAGTPDQVWAQQLSAHGVADSSRRAVEKREPPNRVPAAESPRLEFALASPRPNPSSRGFEVEFSLPDASPATLEIIDVSGRRVWARQVGDLGVGRHALHVSAEPSIPPGVYLVRLAQADRSVTVREAVMR